MVPISDRTRLPFAVSDQRVVLHRRLSLCFPASLETYQREHPELALLRPVGLTARPGRLRAEEILLVFLAALLRGGTVFSFYCKELFLTAIHGNQVRDELARHRQRRAVGIAFLLFLVVEHGQLRAVARRHLRRLDERRLQMLVALF